jgi:hypothetical protein
MTTSGVTPKHLVKTICYPQPNCSTKSGVPSLVTLGYVKFWILDLIDLDMKEWVYEITNAGRTALAAVQEAAPAITRLSRFAYQAAW